MLSPYTDEVVYLFIVVTVDFIAYWNKC